MNEIVLRRVWDFIKDNDIQDINIVGGEPTLHPEFDTIVPMLANGMTGFRMVTNGSWAKYPYGKKAHRIVSALLDARANVDRDYLEWFEILMSDDQYHREFWSEYDLDSKFKNAMYQDIESDYDGYISFELWDNVTIHTDKFPGNYRNFVAPIGRGVDEYCGDNKIVDCCHLLDKVIQFKGIDKDGGNIYENDDYAMQDITWEIFKNMTIFPNGDVAFCCHGQAIVGNMVKNSIDTIVENTIEFVNEINRLHDFEETPKDDFCSKCKRICDKFFEKESWRAA